MCVSLALGTDGGSAALPRRGWGDPAKKWFLTGDWESSFSNAFMQIYLSNFPLVGKSQNQKELN